MSQLVQSEADALRVLPKRLMRKETRPLEIPLAADKRTFELESLDRRHAFLIDVNRAGKIKLTRCSNLERFRSTIILARLDIDGPPHTNPTVPIPPLSMLSAHNGATLPCPHFHLFVEGFDDRWAVPAADAGFTASGDLVEALREFMIHCGVQDVPTIQYPII